MQGPPGPKGKKGVNKELIKVVYVYKMLATYYIVINIIRLESSSIIQ